jgi:hypothetical protein
MIGNFATNLRDPFPGGFQMKKQLGIGIMSPYLLMNALRSFESSANRRQME